jgi:hypothetical protein
MSKDKIPVAEKKAKGIEEGPPIWVESVLSNEDWKDTYKKYPNTHNLKEKPAFFKSDYEWRYRMGAGIPQDQIDLITKRFDTMLKMVNI